VAIRIDPARLQIDDEFPNGRKDFRLNVGRPGGSIRVELENEQSAPEDQGAINRSFAGARAANATGAKATTTIRDYGANYEALAGKDVTYTVPTTEGGTASVTVDAQSVLTQYDQRMQALETLRKCL
jgi:hypothetical protein